MNDPKERQKILWQNMLYSIQRIDLLIISVSGAGVYLCLEVLKFMYTAKLPKAPDLLLLKVASAFFVLAIIVNFISQYLSYRSNYYDYLNCCIEQKEEQTDEDQRDLILNESWSSLFDRWTNYCNVASGLLMFVGLLICFGYFVFTF